MQVSTAGRIVLKIVLIQMISAALILGWFFYSVRSEFDEQTLQKAQQTVLRSIRTTEEYFRPAETVVQAAQRLLASKVIGFDRPDHLERYFFEQLRLWQPFAGLYVGYPDGSFLYVMRSNQETAGGTRTKVIRQRPEVREVELTWRKQDYSELKAERDTEDSYDPRTRPWYRAAIERREVVWTTPYIFFSSRTPGITASVAVTNDDGTIAAVVGVDIEMTEVSKFLGQIAFGKGRSAFIVTPDGEVIAHSSINFTLPDSAANDNGLRFRKVNDLDGIEGAIGDRILKQFSEHADQSAPIVWKQASDEQDYFAAMGPMSNANWPWLIAAIVPEKSLIGVAGTSKQFLIGVILLATGLACALGYALGQSIGRPLAALQLNAKLARRGNTELMEEVASGYKEINETADTLLDLARLRRQYGPPSETGSKDEAADNGEQAER